MLNVKFFTFNPFEENTYVLHDDTGQCLIIDAGCYESHEQRELSFYIEKNNLKPVMLLNTHCHIDHVLGNRHVADKYKLVPVIPQGELELLRATTVYGPAYGIKIDPSPEPEKFLHDNDVITFGNTQLKCLLTPGHSPASMCFYNQAAKILIGGDVLFYRSIGRTDLPGGNHQQLLQSIRTRLFTLPGDVIVYPGHGIKTTIADEMKLNPFVGSAS